MIKLKLIILLIAIMILAGTCDYYDNRLKIYNNSNYSITFDYSLDTVLENRSNENIPFFLREMISPGETVAKTKPSSTQAWSFQIQRSYNKKLNIFIISVDTLIKYNDWSYIKQNRLYQRYELTEEELNNNNWIIEYP